MAVTVAQFSVEPVDQQHPFDMQEALGGKLVTIKNAVTDVLADAGQVTYEPSSNGGINAPYHVIINTKHYWADESGVIRKGTVGENETNQLKLVTSTLPETYGSQQDITRGSSGYNDHADISGLEPRDQFAMSALNAMLMKLDRPEGVNNSTILLYSRAAYRWAQGMMIAAADARALVSGGGQPSPSYQDTSKVNAELTSASTGEKLLNNVIAAIDNLTKQLKTNGVVVVGSANQSSTPVKAAISSMPAVTISGTPNVNVANTPDVNINNTPDVNVTNTPDVNIANTPDVNVDNMPSSIQVTGTVSVDNFPNS